MHKANSCKRHDLRVLSLISAARAGCHQVSELCTDRPLGPQEIASLALGATHPLAACDMVLQPIAVAGALEAAATASLPAGTRRNATGLPLSANSAGAGSFITPIAAEG